MASRDIYGRRPTSTSRGKTNQRIMALQHAQGVIPGAEQALEQRPAGSIAEAMMLFHAAWVESKPVTTRRGYERSLAFFARDLAEQGPAPHEPLTTLDQVRLGVHLDWRRTKGLDDPGELQRAGLHLTRFYEWSTTELGAELPTDRTWMRAQAEAQVASAPPPFHVAKRSDQLRDTSGDAESLGVSAD